MTGPASRRIVITGGTRGLGLEIVRLLAANGDELIFTGRSIASVDRALDALGRPAHVTGHACDVRDDGAMTAIMAGGCDVLINNAAVSGGFAPLHETPANVISECLEINLTAALTLSRLAVQHMLAAGGGTIINVSSGAGFHAVPRAGPYCISKAGLAMATRCIHAEYGDQNIRSFGFQPGVVDTEMQAELQSSGLPPALLPPLDIMVQPQEPARAIAWLCGDGSDDFIGREFSIYDEDLRTAAGL